MTKAYPAWIDEFAVAMHQALSNMIPSRWSSLDGLKTIATLNGVFLLRIAELIQTHERIGTPIEKLWKLFAHPSSLRSAFLYLIWEYRHLPDKSEFSSVAKKTFDFMDKVLDYGMQEDKWVLNSNKIHSQKEIEEILAITPWVTATPELTRSAGQLYVATASIGFALYRDFFPQEAHEIFGSYDVSEKFGTGAKLVIKYHPKLRPVEFWPEVKDFPYSSIRIYQVFHNVNFRCEFIGMHSIYDGPVVPNTMAIAVEVDGKFLTSEEIKKTTDIIAHFATEYSHLYEKLSISEMKKKFMEWECYQFVELFKAAGMDWRPTEEMIQILEQADIGVGFGIESLPPFEEFIQSEEWEVVWLKRLYQES